MNPVTRICPVSDAEAAGLAGAATLADLARQITDSPPVTGTGRAAVWPDGRSGTGRYAGRRSTRHRLLIGIPVAAALALAGLVVTSAGKPGEKVGPVSFGPASARAAVLSVTRHGGYLRVIVTNPLADAKQFRAEFARYGLDISLTLVPASPSLVGTLVFTESGPSITPITAVGRCYSGGGGSACPVGVEVPLGYKGYAQLTFGRAARPGERYETTAPANAPGEAMHGLNFAGKTVAQVLAMLAARHVTAAQYLVNVRCQNVLRASAPASWFVSNADPWAPGEVVLWVSKTWPDRRASCATTPPPAPLTPKAG